MAATVTVTHVKGAVLPLDTCDEIARFIARNLGREVTAADVARCHTVVLARCKFTTSLVAVAVLKAASDHRSFVLHELDWLCVSSNFRGNGIGSRLIASVPTSLPSGAMLKVYVPQGPEHDRTVFFYRAHAYEVLYQNQHETGLQLRVQNAERGVALFTAAAVAGLVAALAVRVGVRVCLGLWRR
jgi:GNAT superfamily N-acetyltransferase